MKAYSLSDVKSLKEDVEYVKEEWVRAVKMRWVQCQCYEIKLPNGKTIVTDPFFCEGKIPNFKLPRPITADDFEGCDYILLNHSHGDHILSVPDLFQRFHPTIICDSRYIFKLSEVFDIPFGYLYPIDPGHSYVFDDFRLEVTQAIHNRSAKSSGANYDPLMTEKNFGIKGTGDLEKYGALWNLNFMFTLPNNFRIGFAAGVDMPNMKENWRVNGPDLLMRQRMCVDTAEDYANDIEALGGMITVPTQHETAFEFNSNMAEYIHRVNEILAEKGYAGRALNPKRMQWYTISFGITEG